MIKQSQKDILKIVKKSGSSFYWAIRLLPREKRYAMQAIYAFCRTVDDIADGKDTAEGKLISLKEWRNKIELLYKNSPTDVVTLALADHITKYKLDKKDFLSIIDGMETDTVNQVRINNKKELFLYCDRVACAVGRLSNRVFGLQEHESIELAEHLGYALQLTNILRDIREDANSDRVYVPMELINVSGERNILADEILKHRNFNSACQHLAQMAQKCYITAKLITSKCNRKNILPAIIMMKLYFHLLQALERRGLENHHIPVKISKAYKLWIIIVTLILRK